MVINETEKLTLQESYTLPVKVYGCGSSDAGIINTYGCKGCKSLSKKPVEVVEVPIELVKQEKDAHYVSKVSRFSRIIQSITCQNKTPKSKTK